MLSFNSWYIVLNHISGGINLKFKLPLITLIFTLSILFSGCGDSNELKQFHKEFDDFCNSISTINDSINNLDASSENAPQELLKLLDELDLKFKELANMNIPSDFTYMESLAKEASENMSLAVENFHKTYESGTYNYEAASQAEQYLNRAHKRVKYMISFMHGETPDDGSLVIE